MLNTSQKENLHMRCWTTEACAVKLANMPTAERNKSFTNVQGQVDSWGFPWRPFSKNLTNFKFKL